MARMKGGGSSFQSVVMTVATVLLILALIIIAIVTWTKQTSKNFPPVVSDCPDYWADMSRGNASNCVNVHHVGNKDCPNQMNFSAPEFRGPDGICGKLAWAQRCQQTWDGVTNSSRTKHC
tara:strand:+ start:861 stop:1220 length:360 start_codon:yes stop_codon:yes gene_type:complete